MYLYFYFFDATTFWAKSKSFSDIFERIEDIIVSFWNFLSFTSTKIWWGMGGGAIAPAAHLFPAGLVGCKEQGDSLMDTSRER